MAKWSDCAICGRAIPVGELCYGIKNWRGDPDGGDTICRDCLVPENAPTLTSPNEWVSVETPPTEQGWYHVAILDLKTGKYTVEQDLYSIELAKAHGFEPGFCKANRRKERERIDYWCRFPAPPDRRPPKGEMKNGKDD